VTASLSDFLFIETLYCGTTIAGSLSAQRSLSPAVFKQLNGSKRLLTLGAYS